MTELPRCYRHPDRETAVSCSECGRPICPDCMVFAPVGIRCPDHSGQPQGVQRVAQTARRVGFEGRGMVVTKTLIALNVGIYLVQLAMGASVSASSGWIFEHFALVASAIYSNGELAGVAHGEWWRLLTAAFLHYGPIHLGLNMLAVWWIGGPLEELLGRGRYLLLYVVSGLAGSAGALIADPNAVTVGASGAIFGIIGALLVIEYQRTGSIGGPALTLLAVNLAFTFFVPNISIGGHLGGLVGGVLGTLALSRFGRGHVAYGRLGLIGVGGLVAVGALSVAIAYLKVM